MGPLRKERLEKTLARVAREQGLDQERLRRWVSFLALCGVLERAMQEGVLRNNYLKGGVAMELRFAAAARATKDLDIGLEGDAATRLASLESALRLGFDEFTFRMRRGTRHFELADTVRIEVSLLYRTKAWQTIDVDLGSLGNANADLVNPVVSGLAEIGVPVTTPIRCISLSEQVAQKVHACTGPQAAGRARDVLDILLIEMLGELDYASTKTAINRVFAERNTHPMPQTIQFPAVWTRELETMAHAIGFPMTTVEEIKDRFHGFLNRVTN